MVQKERSPEEVGIKQLRLYIAIPILCIVVAELLLFFDRIGESGWFHIGILIALSLLSIFIKDPRVDRIFMPLMLLLVLRIISLSMPIFFINPLFNFILIYIPLAIPVTALIIQQQDSLKEIGITKEHLFTYMIISIPLSFFLGAGEYLINWTGYLNPTSYIMRTEYFIRIESLIPDITLGSLLKITIFMVFFVGLIEEFIFRSLLQTRLENTFNVPGALIITSLLYGFMHSGYGNGFEILYACFVGLVIGLIYNKTKSLPFVSVLHGLINVFLFGILPHI